MAATQPWVLFIPVDVPLVSEALLRRWAEKVLSQAEVGCGLSSLSLEGKEQPAFCIMRRECGPVVGGMVAAGERRIRLLLSGLEQDGLQGWMWMADVRELAADLLHAEFPDTQLQSWFANVNTQDELLFAEARFGPE